MPSKFTTLLTSILALLSLQTFIATSPNQLAFAKDTIKYQLPGRVSPDQTDGSGTWVSGKLANSEDIIVQAKLTNLLKQVSLNKAVQQQ
jgi:hypothetical protein